MTRPRLLPIVLAGGTSFLDLYVTQPLLPLLMRLFDASHFTVSLTVTAPTIAVALSAPIVGRLADLIGRKRVIVGSAAALTVVTALCATATSLPQLIAWRFLQGLLTPGVFATTIAYIQDEFPSASAGRASGAYVAGTVTGGFVGRTLAGLTAASAGWRAAFLAVACANVLATLGLWLWLPSETKPTTSGHGHSHRRSVQRLLGNRRLLATNVIGFCLLFSQIAVFTYVTFYLSDPPFHASTVALAWLFAVFLVGAAIVPLAGRVIDARGYRATIVGGMLVGACGALLTLVPMLPAVVSGLALVGTGVFIGQATASSYIGVVTPHDRGLAVGLYSTAYYIGGSLGGTLPSFFWTRGGWMACVVLVLAVQLITVSMVLLFWRESRRGPAAPPVAVE